MLYILRERDLSFSKLLKVRTSATFAVTCTFLLVMFLRIPGINRATMVSVLKQLHYFRAAFYPRVPVAMATALLEDKLRAHPHRCFTLFVFGSIINIFLYLL